MKNLFSNLFKKKSEDQKITSSSTNSNKSGWFEKFFKKRLGNKAKGEDVVGVEISGGEIRLAQISQANSGKWNLNKFYIHKIIGLPEEANITDHADLVSEQLKIAVEKSKISTSNAAVAIPVTKFVAPGPEVPKHTPTSPVDLAYPSAACEPPCSCLTI